MAYVKAKVPEEVQRAINMEAAQYGMNTDQTAGQILQEWYNESPYDIEVANE